MTLDNKVQRVQGQSSPSQAVVAQEKSDIGNLLDDYMLHQIQFQVTTYNNIFLRVINTATIHKTMCNPPNEITSVFDD